MKMNPKEREHLLNVFGDVYDQFYNNPDMTLTMSQDTLTNIGDALMKLDNQFLREFAEYRGDICTSDREVASYAVTYLVYLANHIDVAEEQGETECVASFLS